MWYIVQTLKGKENTAAGLINRDVTKDGEEVFVLESERMFKIRKEWISQKRPMFPGYIFVCTDFPEDFDSRLRRKQHPLKLLRVDEMITPIYPEEEKFLKQIGGEDHIVHYSEGFKIGEKIVIESGAFAGYTGDIIKLDRHKRQAVIGISLMGRMTEVTIGLGIVKSCDP